MSLYRQSLISSALIICVRKAPVPGRRIIYNSSFLVLLPRMCKLIGKELNSPRRELLSLP